MKAHKSTQPCSHVSFFLRNDPGDIQEFAMHWGRAYALVLACRGYPDAPNTGRVYDLVNGSSIYPEKGNRACALV